MLQQMYPFWAAIVANLTAQLLKPVIRYIRTRDWDWHLALESGGFPSSHTRHADVFADRRLRRRQRPLLCRTEHPDYAAADQGYPDSDADPSGRSDLSDQGQGSAGTQMD